VALIALACALSLSIPSAAAAQESQAVEPQTGLARPPSTTRPPPGHSLSAREAIAIAARSPSLRRELAKHPGHRREAFTKGPRRWQVSYYADGEEIAQVVVDER
jgi:hypothetical protein